MIRPIVLSLFVSCSLIGPTFTAAHVQTGNEESKPSEQAKPTEEAKRWEIEGQLTYVAQVKPRFRSPYEGQNSLIGARETSYSLTSSFAAKLSPWKQGEFEFHVEAAMGRPLSRLAGLGGLSNAELARTSGAGLTAYRARAFYAHRFNEQWQLTAGNFSALDIFDDNQYARDPRNGFMNWSFLTHGAWDYPADSRGYSWGWALEHIREDWALRWGRFILPKESNGLDLDPAIFARYGDVLEWEYRYDKRPDRQGKMRLIAFRNVTRMGSFRESLQQSPVAPDLASSRQMRSKSGVGITLEQELGKHAGAFLRASIADGRSETYAFTEIDRSLSFGAVIKGSKWQRPKDAFGVAVAINGLSSDRQAYLGAGGVGFFLGDGRLNYAPERIVEIYYRLFLGRGWELSLDWQHITNPGYNQDRGPVQVLGTRLHVDF